MVGLPTIEVAVVVGEEEEEEEADLEVTSLEATKVVQILPKAGQTPPKVAALTAMAPVLLELATEQLLHHLPKRMEILVLHRIQSLRSIAYSSHKS